MLEAGQKQVTVAAIFNVQQSTISRIWQLYGETGTVKERSGRGRKRKTDPADDNFIRNITLRDRFISAPQLQRQLRDSTHLVVSVQTVRNRLQEAGLRTMRLAKRIPLTPMHRRNRLQWARDHVRWNRHLFGILGQTQACVAQEERTFC